MIVLTLLSYIGAVVGFVGAVLSIASALYYVSEFVEEHSGFARRVIDRSIYAIWLILLLEWAIDRQPLYLCVVGAASHYIYRTNLQTFPIIRLSSGRFILAVVATVINHVLWFRHFSGVQKARRDHLTYGSGGSGSGGGGGSGSSGGYDYKYDSYTGASSSSSSSSQAGELPEIAFGQVASFFLFCVWLVPFALFVSLSAGDLVLPTSTSATGGADGGVGDPMAGAATMGGQSTRRAGGFVKTLYKSAGRYIDPLLQQLGIAKGDDELVSSHRRYA